MNLLEMRELDVQEMKNVNGGGISCPFWAGALFAVALEVGSEIAANHEAFMEGYREARAQG